MAMDENHVTIDEAFLNTFNPNYEDVDNNDFDSDASSASTDPEFSTHLDISPLLPDPDSPNRNREDGMPPYRVSAERWPYMTTRRLDNEASMGSTPIPESYIWADDVEPPENAALAPGTLPPGFSFAFFTPEQIAEHEEDLRQRRKIAWLEHRQGYSPTGGPQTMEGVMYKALQRYERPPCTAEIPADLPEDLKRRLTAKERAEAEEALKPCRTIIAPDGIPVRLDDPRGWQFANPKFDRPVNERILLEMIKFLSIHYRMEKKLVQEARLTLNVEDLRSRGQVDAEIVRSQYREYKVQERERSDFVWTTIRMELRSAGRKQMRFNTRLFAHIAGMLGHHIMFPMDYETEQDWVSTFQDLERQERRAIVPLSFHDEYLGTSTHKALMAAQYKVLADDGYEFEMIPDVEVTEKVLAKVSI